MAMSNRNYGGSRYEPRGRNADFGGTMFKRTPIFNHQQIEKQESSPFLNYNAKTGQSFISDSSQNTQAEDRISQELVRQIIKEEMSKNHNVQQNNRKIIHTLQAQITDLKEKMGQNEKQNHQKMQQSTVALREEIRVQADRMGKEVQEQITSKLRSFFQKVNTQLKKDILRTVQQEFLTTNYGQDLQNRLEIINERIDSVSGLIQSKQFSSEEINLKMQKASLVDNIEPKISKLEKQIQQRKSHHNELINRIKPIEEWMNQENQKRNQNQVNDKIQSIKQKIKILDQELQKKVGALQIQMSGADGDMNIVKEKIAELKKYNEEQRALYLDLNRRFSSSRIQYDSKEEKDLSTSIIMNNPILAEHLKQKDEIKQESQPGEETVKKTVYQVDNDGYLMDGQGKYLLTQEGTMIKLNPEQISALIDSNAVEILET